MPINLATKYLPYVDEIFTTESKKSLLTNQDFDWTGAHTVKIYKVTTASMTDYGRDGAAEGNWSRYGAVGSLDATTEEMTLTKDRSFTFAIDKLDADETAGALAAASALARQVRQVVVPEVDSYVYGKMIAGAGSVPEAAALTSSNIYEKIVTASAALDEAEAPETGRVLLVTPATYLLMKQCSDITMETEIGADMRLRGVIANLDGCVVIKVPAARVPLGFGFMMAHPSATVAPTKLEDYTMHSNPPGISGDLVEGRICYDAFVLTNKAGAIYFQETFINGSLTVTSVAGSASGKTAITVTETIGTGNSLKYKVGNDAADITLGQSLDGFSSWDGEADITAASGKVITIVEANSSGKAVRAGSATVVSAT